MENEMIKENEVKGKAEKEMLYKEVPYDEAVNKIGLRARKDKINDELKDFSEFKGGFVEYSSVDYYYVKYKFNNIAKNINCDKLLVEFFRRAIKTCLDLEK